LVASSMRIVMPMRGLHVVIVLVSVLIADCQFDHLAIGNRQYHNRYRP